MSNLTTSRPEQPATLTPEAARTTGELGHLPARDCPSWSDRSRTGHRWQIDPVDIDDSCKVHRHQIAEGIAVTLYEWADGSDAPNLQVDPTLGVTTAADAEALSRYLAVAAAFLRSIGGVA